MPVSTCGKFCMFSTSLLASVRRVTCTVLLLVPAVAVGLMDEVYSGQDKPLLLVVLYDGFRWDYLDKFHTPNFHKLMSDGVRATRVHNVYPTSTMPNHYTILTGWYPESHGIVDNNFYDPKIGLFRMGNWTNQEESKWFDTGPEPIWVTNQLKSNKRFTGSLLWPDSLAKVKDIGTTFKIGPPLFDESVKNETRVETIIRWFLDPFKPINLGLLYFEEPDEIGHGFGPDSVQVKDTIMGLDNVTGYLIEQLKSHDLFDRMNIIMTGDHGMSTVLPEHRINISEVLSADVYSNYSLTHIAPKPGFEQEVYDGLLKLQKKYPQMQVHLKNDSLMKSIHYSNNDRMAPITITVDEGWYLINENSNLTVYPTHAWGSHGYLPSVVNMNPFFVAHGPAFKKGYVTASLNNIDFYELMCHLLKLSPGPNNGSLDKIKHILAADISYTDYTVVTYLVVAGVCASIASLFMIAACRQQRIRKRVVSLEDLTLFQMEHDHEHKVPLLEDENDDL